MLPLDKIGISPARLGDTPGQDRDAPTRGMTKLTNLHIFHPFQVQNQLLKMSLVQKPFCFRSRGPERMSQTMQSTEGGKFFFGICRSGCTPGTMIEEFTERFTKTTPADTLVCEFHQLQQEKNETI